MNYGIGITVKEQKLSMVEAQPSDAPIYHYRCQYMYVHIFFSLIKYIFIIIVIQKRVHIKYHPKIQNTKKVKVDAKDRIMLE